MKRSVLAPVFALALVTSVVAAQAQSAYFPPAGSWAHRDPAALGLDPVKLRDAIAWAQAHETERALDFSDQEETFGTRLGSMPTRRAHTNGVVIYQGFVVAEFGDTAAVDPTYSVAKSMLATVAGVGVRAGRIADLMAPVGQTVLDGGYAEAPNAGITWQHHLQQESEWQGSLWGKNANFIGAADFGAGARTPRAAVPPGRCSSTTTCASTALRCRCCVCSTSRCRTCSSRK